MYNDFYRDLEDGKRGERLVIAALAARGHKITDLSNDRTAQRRDIDLLLDNGTQQTTLEIKNDMASERTGNLFIETYNAYNQSHSCKGWYFYCNAEYLCFIQEHNGIAHIASFEDIKQSIASHSYKKAKTYSTEGILLPITEIKQLKTYYCLSLLENNVSCETMEVVKQ